MRENELLLKFPAYISLLAINTDGIFDIEERFSAIELAHIKTYSCDPRLLEFFDGVNTSFEKTIDEGLEKTVLKLGSEYINIIHQRT